MDIILKYIKAYHVKMAKISIFEKGLLLNNLIIINQALSWFQTDISQLRGHLYLFNEVFTNHLFWPEHDSQR